MHPNQSRQPGLRGTQTVVAAIASTSVRFDLSQRLPGSISYESPMIKRRQSWDTRSTISRWAHVLERTGLALTGCACGLFVAAHVAMAEIDMIGSTGEILSTMLYGAAGFYLGIDLPPVPRDHYMHLPLRHGLGSSWDVVELLSAAGTFVAAVAAIVSVSSIILGETALRALHCF